MLYLHGPVLIKTDLGWGAICEMLCDKETAKYINYILLVKQPNIFNPSLLWTFLTHHWWLILRQMLEVRKKLLWEIYEIYKECFIMFLPSNSAAVQTISNLLTCSYTSSDSASYSIVILNAILTRNCTQTPLEHWLLTLVI